MALEVQPRSGKGAWGGAVWDLLESVVAGNSWCECRRGNAADRLPATAGSLARPAPSGSDVANWTSSEPIAWSSPGFEFEPLEPPEPPLTVVWIAEMESILLMMRLFLVGLPLAGASWRRASAGCWAAAAAVGRQAVELVSEGSPLTLARRAAARCLLLGSPPTPEAPEVPLNSCEAVICRWKRRPGPSVEPLPDWAQLLLLLLLLLLSLEALLAPPPPFAMLPLLLWRAFVLNWRWNMELVA